MSFTIPPRTWILASKLYYLLKSVLCEILRFYFATFNLLYINLSIFKAAMYKVVTKTRAVVRVSALYAEKDKKFARK